MKRLLKWLLALAGFAILFYASANLWVWLVSRNSIIKISDAKPADAVIILGAYVRPDGALSWILKDRLDTGLEVYNSGKAEKIIVTGDHGQKDYNEVQAMKDYLLNHEVPAEDIFMDHAGFDTYDSIYRARDIFQVKSAIIISQNFHLPRAVYISKRLGIETQGVQAELFYPWWYANTIRDSIARVKAYLDVEILKSKPRFLGEAIPITGDGRVTQD
ncbi:MAG: ElyC/SanA/YdcF family protein [Patescibacteria group bacterium]|nr:ElyC/SanA/YdcF family protein [Patescibacteria group bacterium]